MNFDQDEIAGEMHSLPRISRGATPGALPRAHRARRGSVLVEFSLVAFALYLLLVVLLDLGRGSLATQSLQSAADLMARELSRAPISGVATFEEALETDFVRERIFDETLLVIELEGQTPEDITAEFASYPIVNQMLRPLMFEDEVQIDGATLRLLRYPGAIVRNSDDELTVAIPYIEERNYTSQPGSQERLRFVPVVEEVKSAPGAPSHFPINSPSELRGIVSLRINYPYQAATLTGYRSDVEITGPLDAALADDSSVVVTGGLEAGAELAVDEDSGLGPYAGTYGLGKHFSFVSSGQPGESEVRPFRKLIAVQSVARREILFVPETP